jgi:hypothetical protein
MQTTINRADHARLLMIERRARAILQAGPQAHTPRRQPVPSRLPLALCRWSVLQGLSAA